MFQNRSLPRSFVRRLRPLAPTLASLLLAAASFLPGQIKGLIRSRGPLHNVYHLAAFAGLAVLVHLCGAPKRRQAVLAAWAILLGCTIEVAEAARNYAALETKDILFDTLGVLTGLVLAWSVDAWLRRAPHGRRLPLFSAPEPA